MEQSNNSEALTVVTFKHHPTINEAESKKQGRPIYDEIEVCEVKLAGNKKTVGVFPAHQFAPGWQVNPTTGIREQITYAQKYNDQYLAFKNGAAQAQTGTPLEATGLWTTGKCLELKALNVHTVEALAAIDGVSLKQLGMGGRELKNQAEKYLENATGPAALAVQKEANKELLEQMEMMRREIDAMKTGGQPEEVKADPFAEYEDEDIRLWLKEAGVDVHHLWKRPRLLEEANKKNDELAKAAKKDAA